MLTVVVQAGGQSSRMGEDKALKLFLGKPLIKRVIDRLAPVADELIVTTNRPDEYGFLKARLVTDLKPGRGALGGLYTAIASATQPFVAVVACDMPFVSQKFFESAIRLIVQKEADVVIAKTDQGYEPFHALYRRDPCLSAIESAIASDQWRVVSWLSEVQVCELQERKIQELDPAGLCFWNVNTPGEFAEAEEIASTGKI